MASPETFPRFSDLPTELRLHIWEKAFTTPTLIFASPFDHTTIQGPAPWTTGLACKEAWRQLEESCVRYSFGQDEFRPASGKDAHWLHLDTTVLDIASFGTVEDVERGAAHLPLPFKHVLTRTIRHNEVKGGMPVLARLCPHLETLVILHRDRNAFDPADRLEKMTRLLRQGMDAETVARVMRAVQSSQPVVEDPDVDFDGRHRELCRYFPQGHVTLHVLAA